MKISELGRSNCADCVEYQDAENFLLELKEVKADRDRWKKRAEALERALKGEFLCGDCKSCVNNSIHCNSSVKWQFDEARFAEPEEGGESE
jgi:hypothetical protein